MAKDSVGQIESTTGRLLAFSSSDSSPQQLLHPPSGGLAALTGGRSFLVPVQDGWEWRP